MTLPILLQALVAALVIAEIFLPSGGLLSVLALAALGYSLFLAFSISLGMGFAFLVGDIICLPILIISGLKLLAYSPMALRKSLSRDDGYSAYTSEFEEYLGREGVALTDLRPSGTARIQGKKLDVITGGEYIEKGADVVVYQVTGNQLRVRQK